MTPRELRQAADLYDLKSDNLYMQGRDAEADKALDMAIRLRERANSIEDNRNNRA